MSEQPDKHVFIAFGAPIQVELVSVRLTAAEAAVIWESSPHQASIRARFIDRFPAGLPVG